MNQSTINYLRKWVDILEKQDKKPKEDTWTTFELIPKYSFKNVQLKQVENNNIETINQSNNSIEINISLIFDDYKINPED